MPSHVVIGGGVNGLSVGWALAESGAGVLVLDKGRIGSGASGIAGGIVRNYYRAEAITELVRLSVEMFEEDPEAYGFRQVGYLAAVPEAQVDDLIAIREQHERIGYGSELVTGAEACREYLTWSWPDWDAPVEALLHERRGGWADSMQTLRHLAERARVAGAEIREGAEVVGLELGERGVEAVLTDGGERVPCETLVVAAGPWTARLWRMVGLDPCDFFISGRASAVSRSRGRADDWKLTAAGGIVAHTPDNYPVCGWVLENAYAIVDSGHGFKTLAIGRLAAEDIANADESRLEPFRLDRFARGELHAASKSPYPWT